MTEDADSSDTSSHPRRNRKWSDVLDEFDSLMRKMAENLEKGVAEGGEKKPLFYGYSVSFGPDGKPIVKELGFRRGRVSPLPPGIREPVVEVMQRRRGLVVVAQLPGLEKDNIAVRTSPMSLSIFVSTRTIRYLKRIPLPFKIEPTLSKASYRNGVLEVRLTRASQPRMGWKS